MYANSTPTAPPPTITTDAGRRRASSASRLVTTTSPPCGRLHLREQGRVAEERLRRDAAPVAAHPARPVPLDDRRPETELCRPQRGDVPARTRAEDDEVVRHSTSASGFSSSAFSSL